MLPALALLTVGCALRVTTEPLAYGGWWPPAWRLLAISAFIELSAVLLFAFNLGMTLLSPMPAWIERRVINDELSLYWCVNSYPETRRLLVEAGLKTLARERRVPRSLSLAEAAAADGADPRAIVAALQQYFDRRLARALRVRPS